MYNFFMKNFSVTEIFDSRKNSEHVPLIDVRTPAEYGSVHAEGAVNHPMESLNVDRLPFGKEDEIQVICQSGGRSMKVCQKLEAAGFTNDRECGGWYFRLASKWIACGGR